MSPLKIVAVTIVVILLVVLRWLITYIQAQNYKRQTGSLSPPYMPNSGFLGFKLVRENNKALDEGTYLSLARARFQLAGPTYQGNAGGLPFIATMEPENLKSIMTRNSEFVVGPRKSDYFPLLGGGILVADGADWKKSRSLVQPAFTKAQLADFRSLETHVSRLISRIPKNGGTVDLQALFLDMTMSTGLDHIFGNKHATDFDIVENQDRQALLTHNFQLAMFEAGRRAKIGLYRLLDPLVRPGAVIRYFRASQQLHRFIDDLIDDRLETRQIHPEEKQVEGKSQHFEEKQSQEAGRSYVLFDHVSAATQDRMQLRWELASALAGSRDTSAGLLSHIFWELARRPNVWLRLQEDITRTIGDELPSIESLRRMPYLRAVINESLRLYPNIAMTFRWATRNTTLPLGGGPSGESSCFVPQGQRILLSINALHRRRDIWGSDADDFRPERWLVGAKDGGEDGLKAMPAWTYLPFGGGSRICPGQQFALTSSSYTIIRLLQTFARIEDRESGRLYVEDLGIPVTVKNGVSVALISR